MTVGMGKEALKGLFNWLNNDIKMNLSRSDILNVIIKLDIPTEIEVILDQLKSREQRPFPSALPPIIIEEDEDDEEEQNVPVQLKMDI